MSLDAAKALQLETEFLSGVDTNLEKAKGKVLRGRKWNRSRTDETDHLRALMAKNRIFDRTMLKNLPANRRVALHGYDRSWIFFKRRTGIAIASTLSPLEHYISNDGEDAPPIGLGELADHVRKLTGDKKVPHVIGVCSPSGFTEEAHESGLDFPGVSLILIEPDGHGGWKVTPSSDDVDDRLVKLFDPEATGEKLDRVRDLVAQHSGDLVTGSITASTIAKEANLPEELVNKAFERVAADDPEIRLTKNEGECLLYRGAPASTEEKKSMSLVDRIRQLFSRDGDENEKINMLAERRAALATRRDKIYDDITKLEKREADLLAEGKAATSEVPRRRLAAQLAQLRKEIARHNTTAGMLNKQINILSTDVHNLTLITQGEAAKLPDTQELTENAVKAEELLETLQADSELVGSLEVGMAELSISSDEQAILEEFQAADKASIPEETAPQESRAEADPESTQETFEAPEKDSSQASPPDSGNRKEKSGDAEAT